jgi:hypothetical protein
MFALILFTIAAWLACALTVGACYNAFRLASKIRSLHSLQGEILEIDACVRSLLLTIRRMEGRQTALMRSPEILTTTSEPEILDKAALRARYFTPGQPMREAHGDGQVRQHSPGPSDPAQRIRGRSTAESSG